MDNFMDMLTQRFNSKEAIKANSEADAKQLQLAQERAAQSEEAISEMRRLVLKCAEANEATLQAVQAGIEKIEAYSVPTETNNESVSDLLKEQEGYIHKENIRVYRNVQAAVVDELKLQTENLTEQNNKILKKVKGLKALAIISTIFGGISMLAIIADIVIRLFSITITF